MKCVKRKLKTEYIIIYVHYLLSERLKNMFKICSKYIKKFENILNIRQF